MGPEPLAWFRLAYPKTPTAASSTGHYGGLAVSECEGLAQTGFALAKQTLCMVSSPPNGKWTAQHAGPLVAEQHAPLHTKMGK